LIFAEICLLKSLENFWMMVLRIKPEIKPERNDIPMYRARVIA
jgi:hypothetical protein